MIMQAKGFATLRRAIAERARGKPPVGRVVDSFMLMLAGGLLLTPGLITDVAGLLLLIPPVRRLIAALGLRRLMSSAHVTSRPAATTSERTDPGNGPRRREPGPPSGGTVIEGEYERHRRESERPTAAATIKPAVPDRTELARRSDCRLAAGP